MVNHRKSKDVPHGPTVQSVLLTRHCLWLFPELLHVDYPLNNLLPVRISLLTFACMPGKDAALADN